MSYEKQTWTTGDIITAEKLNHMEDGIKDGTYIESTVIPEQTITEFTDAGTTTTSYFAEGIETYETSPLAISLTITLDNVSYVFPIQSEEEGNYYGGRFDENDEPDFTQYPFILELGYDYDSLLYVPTNENHTIMVKSKCNAVAPSGTLRITESSGYVSVDVVNYAKVIPDIELSFNTITVTDSSSPSLVNGLGFTLASESHLLYGERMSATPKNTPVQWDIPFSKGHYGNYFPLVIFSTTLSPKITVTGASGDMFNLTSSTFSDSSWKQALVVFVKAGDNITISDVA